MWCDVTVSDDGYVALTLVDARAAPEPVASQLRRALAALGPAPVRRRHDGRRWTGPRARSREPSGRERSA